MTITALKLLGLCSMLWDHLGALFPPGLFLPGPLARIAPYFGRLAAPIFLYSLVSGFRHTRDRRRYGARLLGFALLSQPAYWLFFLGEARRYGRPAPAFGEYGLNILFTLSLGLVMLSLVEQLWHSDRAGAVLAAAGCMLLARLLGLEGREGYLLIILVLYRLTDGRKRPQWQAVSLLLAAALLARWRLAPYGRRGGDAPLHPAQHPGAFSGALPGLLRL